MGSINLRGRDGSSSTSAIGLHYFTSSASIAGNVAANALWAWDPNVGNGPFSYFLSGGYNVSVVPVSSPLGVSDTGPLDSLGTRQFTVGSLYGLELLNPVDWSGSWPAGSVDWHWIPGDSVSANPASEGIWIPECHFQTTCLYAPSGPGRMQASAYVEMQAAGARGAEIGVCESAALALDGDSVPPGCADRQTSGCPYLLMGKVITAGIQVGTTLHTFEFGGTMTRLDYDRSSPARYTIARPITSTDGWWTADEGWVGVKCWGVFYHR